jgi:CspA family cold shock protein
MIATGTVSWFKLESLFGFVNLGSEGDAFLHMSVLKRGGYVYIPPGTTMRVDAERQGGRLRVVEVLAVDVSTARPGAPPAVLRRVRGAAADAVIAS